MAFCLVFGGGTYLFGQAAVKTNLSADQQKVMDIQQQELAQQNKTREVSILNHPTFPKFVELHDMNLAAANYETAKKAWIEENYEEYNKIIQQSNTSLTPNN
jgi:hypothetical protein